MPRKRTVDELRAEVDLTTSWRTPGPVNSYFKKPPIMKAKILDAWTAARVDQPVRNYEKLFNCK